MFIGQDLDIIANLAAAECKGWELTILEVSPRKAQSSGGFEAHGRLVKSWQSR